MGSQAFHFEWLQEMYSKEDEKKKKITKQKHKMPFSTLMNDYDFDRKKANRKKHTI